MLTTLLATLPFLTGSIRTEERREPLVLREGPAMLAPLPTDRVDHKDRTDRNDRTGNTRKPMNVDFLLVDVIYSHLRIDSTLTALQDADGNRYIPLRRLSTALGYRLHVEPQAGTVSGFLSRPSDRFTLSSSAGTVRRGNVDTKFDPSLCFEREQDLYVDAELFSRIAGLSLKWDLDRLEMEVHSDDPLPLRNQWIAKHDLPPAAEEGDGEGERPMRIVKNPYRLYSAPAVDLGLSARSDPSQVGSQWTSTPSFIGHGDLMYMSSEYKLSPDANGNLSPFVNLSRTDPDGKLLGKLGARVIGFGDLNLAPSPLMNRSRAGRGITISSIDGLPTSTSGEDTLSGRAPPNTTVELYQDDVLARVTTADQMGHYRFPEVHIDPGQNDLRIVKVSPTGDVQEERHPLVGDESAPPSGSTRYRFTAAETGRNLMGEPTVQLSTPGTSSGSEYWGEVQHGIGDGKWFSLSGGVTESSSRIGVGFNGWEDKTSYHVKTTFTSTGDAAFSIGASSRGRRNSMSFNLTRVSTGPLSEQIPDTSIGATSVAHLSYDGHAGSELTPLSYGFAVDRYDGSASMTDFRARLGRFYGPGYLTLYQSLRLSDDVPVGTGLLQYSTKSLLSAKRFELGYQWGKNNGIQLARATKEDRILNDFRIRYGLEGDFTRTKPYSLVGTLFQAIGPMTLGLNLSVGGDGVKIGLNLATGLDFQSRSRMASPGVSGLGQAQVRVFLDRNMSGKFDAGDALLPGVSVSLGGRSYAGTTNAEGNCLLERVPANEVVSISVNEETLENPNWVAAKKSITVLARPGNHLKVDFAIVETSEVVGKVDDVGTLKDKGNLLPLFDRTIELVNAKGKVIDSGSVDPAGGFVLSRVWPGNYMLRLKNAQGEVLAHVPFTPKAGTPVTEIHVPYDSALKTPTNKIE